MADRNILQVHQAEFEDKIVCWHEQERSDDTNLDRIVHLLDDYVLEVCAWIDSFWAADNATIADQPV